MPELTDAELERKVAEKMGLRKIAEALGLRWHEAKPDAWAPAERHAFWIDRHGYIVGEFHPLEVGANGQPTERAAAQSWDVLLWLLRRSQTFDADFWLNDEGGEEFEVYTMCAKGGRANTFARAVCEAAVAVGDAAP